MVRRLCRRRRPRSGLRRRGLFRPLIDGGVGTAAMRLEEAPFSKCGSIRSHTSLQGGPYGHGLLFSLNYEVALLPKMWAVPRDERNFIIQCEQDSTQPFGPP